MWPLPLELAFLVPLVAIANPATALPHISARDAYTPCTGGLAPLNTKGLSPGSIYEQLQQTCSGPNSNPPLCRCNLIAYNLNMAQATCQQNNITNWVSWSSANLCNSSSGPLDYVPYDTGSIVIPNWAHQSLSSAMSFDLEAVLPASKGWSTMQIATPIVVAIVVLMLAGIAFFFYRRRKRYGSFMPHKQRKAWENAKLRGPRRFFGLMPETRKVKTPKARDPQWEIDENNMLDESSPPLEDASTQRMGYVRSDTASMHSRTTSVTSLLSSPSPSLSSGSRGIFSTMAAKFSMLSLNRTYQSGTTKGPDYKRVQVLAGQPDRQFGIDGGLLAPRQGPGSTSGGGWAPSSSASQSQSQSQFQSVSTPTPAAAPEPPSRESTMPSVLDIRGAPSTVMSSGAHRSYGPTVASSMFVPDDDTFDFTSPVVAQSDYSLGTTDLQTPITPSRDAAATALIMAKTSPGSPLLASDRYTSLNAFVSPLPPSRRNQSTDSLAYELYPRPRG